VRCPYLLSVCSLIRKKIFIYLFQVQGLVDTNTYIVVDHKSRQLFSINEDETKWMTLRKCLCGLREIGCRYKYAFVGFCRTKTSTKRPNFWLARPDLQSCETQKASESGQVKHVEERSGELVVAGSDGAVDLEMTNQALDTVALAIEPFVPSDRSRAVRSRRDHGPDAGVVEAVAYRVTVVALVGDQGAGPRVRERAERFELRAIGRLAAGEVEGEREAGGITETVNFTGEPAPRAAKSLFTSPPFAPAADTWPRTVVESRL